MKKLFFKIAFQQINRALDLMIISIVCEPLYDHCFIKLSLFIKTFNKVSFEKKYSVVMINELASLQLKGHKYEWGTSKFSKLLHMDI